MSARNALIAALAIVFGTAPVAAQQRDSTHHPAGAAARLHASDSTHKPVGTGAGHHASMDMTGIALPTLPGQDAYAAIGEIIRLLDADPNTDWSKVNIEALRQHLIDMNEVTLKSAITQRAVPGGLEMDVTGTGRTATAIRTMAAMQSAELTSSGMLDMSSSEIPGGARLTARATNPNDAQMVARIRALGFIGLMTLGDHHLPHHLGMALGGHPGRAQDR